MTNLYRNIFIVISIFFLASTLLAQNANIDKTLNKVKDLKGKSAQLLDKVNAANTAMGKANSITNDFNRLNSEVNNTYNALSPLTSLPVLGTPIRVLVTSLNMSKNKLGAANSGLEKIKAPVIDQAAGNVSYAQRAAVAFNSYLRATERDLSSMKERGGDANAINARLIFIDNSLAGVESNFHDMEKTCRDLNNIGGPVGRVDNGVKNFDRVFRNVDKVSHEVNKVLDSHFKHQVKILRKNIGIDISLRKVLEGGKIGKEFKKLVNAWVSKLTQPLLQKLNIKIPEVPGVDEFKNALNNSLDLTRNLKQQSIALENIIQKSPSYKGYSNNPTQASSPSVNIQAQVSGGTIWKWQAHNQTILKSDNGRYSLILQNDGNLVEYDQNSKPLWALGTNGQRIDNLQFQGDGNFVLYGPGNRVLWASGSVGADRLILQDDGNLVIYQGVSPRYASQSDRGKRIN